MPIRVTCPECESSYSVSDELKGKKIRCRKCEALIPIGLARPKPKAEEEIEEAKPASHKMPPAKKHAPPARRRHHDDDDDDEEYRDDRPRSKKAKKSGTSPIMIGVVAGGVVMIVILVGVLLYFSDGGLFSKKPVAATPPPVFMPPPGGGGVIRPGMGPDEDKQPGIDLGAAGKGKAPDKPPPDKVPPDPGPAAGGGGGGGNAGQRIYPYLLKSTVWIVVPQKGLGVASGSGSLIDRTNRIILTNYHVVQGGSEYAIFFPMYHKDGQAVAERDAYLKYLQPGGGYIKGRVLGSDRTVDLALIQIDRLPDGVEALTVANRSPTQGESVHSVGSPGGSGALWLYTPGRVRQVYKKKWQARGPGLVLNLDAQVVETDSATNPGDSGGPLTNDRGELVGVTQGGGSGQLLSTFIDQSEVRQLIDRYFQSPDKKKDPNIGEKWVRSTRPLVSTDGPAAGGPRGSIPDLVAKLKSPDARARGEGAQRLGEMGTAAKAALPDLIRRLKDDDDLVRRLTQDALRAIGPPAREDIAPLLIPALDDPAPEVRLYVLDLLAKMGPGAQEALPAVVKLFDDTDPKLRSQAVRTAGKVGAKDRTPLLTALDKALKDGDKSVRAAAGDVLAVDVPLTPADRTRLEGLLTHADPELRSAGARGLGRLGAGAKEALPALLGALKDGATPASVRLACLQALVAAGAGPNEVVPELQKALRDSDLDLRRAAVETAGKLGPAGAPTVANLVLALDEKELRKLALTALSAIGPAAARDGAATVARYVDDTESRLDVLATLVALKPSGGDMALVAPKLIEALGEEKKKDVRSKMIDILAGGGKGAVAPLTKALANNNPRVREGVAEALGQIGPDAKAALQPLIVLLQADPSKEVRDAVGVAITKIRR